MSIVLQSSGGGSVTLQEAVTASNLTITVPAVTGTMATSTTPSFTTTIGVGGATPAASGAGITFPSTQSASTDANTLDDYEEGTFSPTILGGSVAGTATYARQNGIYTKIGNRVFFTIQIEWSSGTGSGALIIGGLPFTQNGNGSDTPYSASESGNIDWAANYTPTPVGAHNTTNIYINASRVGAAGTSINTTYDAAGYFSMTGHYRIA
jgi:hypothetical protein